MSEELKPLSHDVMWQLLQNQAAMLIRLKNMPVNQGKLFESMDQSAIEKCLNKTADLMQRLENTRASKPGDETDE